MSNPTTKEPESTDDPLQPTFPLSTRIAYTTKVRAIQLGSSTVIGIARKLNPAPTQPTKTKSYPCRPNLENRVFLPPKYNEEKSTKELFPLYLDIHGGGYCIGQPSDDDEFCYNFSNHFNVIVVSLNYSKSPQHPYPTAVNDIAAIASAVINDSSLRVDKTRVAIGGFSAGGTLALAACQIPELRKEIKACTPFYPPTDLSVKAEEKLKTRPWRKEDNGVDMLSGIAHIFDYAYMPPGTHLKDPKISPSYVSKADLPEWVFITGAEFDMLCHEARCLACKLGGVEKPNGREGKEDESGIEEKFGWEREGGRVRWLMARGLKHGFATGGFGGGGEEAEKFRREKFKEIWLEIGEWLFKGPWAK